ncbi:hypothetical protein QYR09_11570 [Cellulophaga lytica]|nr:hypothetical protein QYR09_11570 [Cellulophaga lytica]
MMLEKGSFIVDWNNPMLVEVNKKDFGNDTYMFKAESKGGIYKGENFLPATHWVIAKTKEGKTDLKIHRFEPYVNTITPNPSPLQKNGFNGLEFILSNTGKIDDILTYENGVVIASFLEIKKNEVVGNKSAKASSDEFDSCSDINYVCNPDETNNGSGGYQRVTTYQYTQWYYVFSNSNGDITGVRLGRTTDHGSYTTWVYVGSSTSPAPIYNYEYRNVSTGAPIAKELVEDKIDDSKLKPCMKTILADLKSLKKGIAHIVTKFAGQNPGYNWELKDGNLTGGTGSTDPPVSYNSATGTISTTFDSQAWSNASDLSWARTMLHESIHANLAVSFKISKPNWIATYPTMVAEWGKLQNWNDVHHEEIARSIVNDVAISLQEYGKNNGYNLTSQFYSDMAWGGLQNTSTFKGLPANDRKRILDTIAIELTGKDVNGNNKTQKGKNAGC